jgi:hypothetical protein
MTDGLHPATHLRAAAWVPDDDPERPWDEAIAPAARWLWECSEAEGAPPLLVSNTQSVSGWGYGDLDEIARAGGHATPQGRTRYDRGPVFAFVPDERSLHFAMDLARGYSLAVVEGSLTPLAEWAAGAGAVNLLTGEVTKSVIPDEVRKDLDSAMGGPELTRKPRCVDIWLITSAAAGSTPIKLRRTRYPNACVIVEPNGYGTSWAAVADFPTPIT